MAGSNELGRQFAGSSSYGGYPFNRAFPLDLPNARLCADGTVLTASSAPAYILTSGTMGRVRWAAAAAVTAEIELDVGVPGEYMVDAPAADDQINFLLIAKSGASGTNPGKFTPTLFYQRAGSAVSSAQALASYKKGLTLDAVEAASFAVSTTFTLTDAPTQPEAVMLQFRNLGLKPFDALRLQITPSQSNNHAVDFFGIWCLPQVFAGMARFRTS